MTDMKNRIEAVQKAVEGKDPVSVFCVSTPVRMHRLLRVPVFLTSMIELAGGKNVFADTEKNWTSAAWEDVIAAEPECIVVMDYLASDPIDQKLEFLKNSDILADVPAIKNDNIIVIDLTDVTAAAERGCNRDDGKGIPSGLLLRAGYVKEFKKRSDDRRLCGAVVLLF